MLIQKQLPQFNNTPTLLIVTGAEHASFYFATDGEITEYASLTAPEHTPDERPGHFEQSSGGETLTAGTAFDPKQAKRDTRQRFLHALPAHIKDITAQTHITTVYVFTPEYMHDAIMSALPHNIKEAVGEVFYGNFTKHHPNKLIAKLKKEHTTESRVPVHKLEVRKILNRFWRRRGK